MTAYALSHDGLFRNLIVTTHATKADAEAHLDATRALDGNVVEVAVDLQFSGPRLVSLYNALAAIAAGNDAPKTVTRFETRSTGQDRTFALIESLFRNKPEEARAAAPSSDPQPSAAEGVDEVAKKKGKKAAAPKKAKAEKKAKGAKALVVEGSSRGKLLKLAVENPGISLASIASRAGVSGEGSLDAKSRARLRLRKVAENIKGTVTFDGDKVASFELPKGMTLEKVFGR